ncbi:hypothetical protein [Metaplanococcus flavidus]|uniref:Uncharacterized protein n=1 Tax=Metaplanococcus flavidus TaxID=569883 RepID=A0ABW3L9X8_9BACL
MAGTNSLTLAAENENGFMDIEVELNTEFWRLKKKRLSKLRKLRKKHVDWSFADPFKIFRHDEEALNKAEIYLLPEELPNFTRTLIEHPKSFPINYSQHMSIERGIYCLRLNSKEPFEDFAARLSKALSVLI